MRTRLAGLTLGGGIGHLRRKDGLSCDNLVVHSPERSPWWAPIARSGE